MLPSLSVAAFLCNGTYSLQSYTWSAFYTVLYIKYIKHGIILYGRVHMQTRLVAQRALVIL